MRLEISTKLICLMLLMLIITGACVSEGNMAAQSSLPPTSTPTPSPTPIPTIEPHEFAIIAQNAHQVVQLEQFGKRHLQDIDWAPSGKYIGAASYTEISIYDSETLDVLENIDPGFWINSFVYGPNSEKLFILNESVQIWDFAVGQFVDFYGYIEGGIENFSISADGQILAISGPAWGGSGDPDFIFSFYNMGTGRRIYTRQQYGFIPSVAVSAEGNLVAASVEFSGIEIFNAYTGELIQTLPSILGQDVFFGPKDVTIIICFGSGNSSPIKIWNFSTSELLTIDVGGCRNPALSADRQKMAFITYDGTIKILDTEDYQITQTLDSNGIFLRSIDFSPDGKSLVAISPDSLIVWDIESSQIMKSLSGFTPSLYFVMFSRDNRTVIGGGNRSEIHAWHIDSGKEIVTTQSITYSPRNSILSPDGKIRTATYLDESTYPSQENIQLIDTETEDVIHELIGHEYFGGEGIMSSIKSIAFNWDSSIVVSAGADSTIRLWDVKTGELLNVFQHLLVSDVAFSHDGRYIATSSWDGTIRLWGIPD